MHNRGLDVCRRWQLLAFCERKVYCMHRMNMKEQTGRDSGRFPGSPDSEVDIRHTTGNAGFRSNTFTYFSLVVLLAAYPGISVLFAEDPTTILKSLNEGTLMVLLIATIIMQWLIFLMNSVAAHSEGTGLVGLGFKKIRAMDFAWAIAFLLGANLLLSGLAWVLAQVGLPMPGELAMLIPTTFPGRIIWVLVSLSAGICEEAAFRGYLMTRIRFVGQTKSWIIPVVLSSLAFGACHAYQGLPGLIVITVYGVMFALLYLRTGSLWPCVIAHFFQDFSALFIPQ
jgi:uncharacterized protein